MTSLSPSNRTFSLTAGALFAFTALVVAPSVAHAETTTGASKKASSTRHPATLSDDATSLRADVGPTARDRKRAAADRARQKKADAALRRAYQKEFAYLLAEKRALQQQLQAAARTAAAAAKTRATDRAALEAKVMDVTRTADAAEDKLANAQRAEETQNDAAAALQSIRQQAATAAGLEDTAPLSAAFARTIEGIREKSRLREHPGRFYSREGIEMKGTIVDIGGVARFGIAGQTAGALAPAGGGAWKVWPASTPHQARAVRSTTPPATFGVFLAAKTDVAVSPPKAKTPLSIVKAGGAVAWVIVGLGGLAVFLTLARLLVLYVLSRGRRVRERPVGGRDLEDAVLELVSRGQVQAASELVHSAPGSLARVLRAALDNIDRLAADRVDLVDERLLREQARADWFASALIVVAAVAPLLGLLGTVTGMISTFDAITEVGTGDPRTLAGGISEALITTELGLIVAIPTLLLGNLLSGLGGRLKQRLEIASLAIHNRIEDRPIIEAPPVDAKEPTSMMERDPRAPRPVRPSSPSNAPAVHTILAGS